MKKIKMLIGIALMSASAFATASITSVNSPTGRATFGSTDVIDWSSLGPSQTPVASPFSISSGGGIAATVSKPSGGFERRDQPNGWGGNFTDGSSLLWTAGSIVGAVDVTFGSLISGFGFQINPDNSDTLTTVDIFDIANSLLVSFSLTTNDRSQPSASFIGFTSDMTDISRFTVRQNGFNDFAINQLSLITVGSSNVPEPTSIALLGLGLLGFAASRRKSAK